MTKMHTRMNPAGIQGILSSIMAAIAAVQQSEGENESSAQDEKAPDVVCLRCGQTLRRFQKSGRLGCPACYETFREQIQPMLQQIHGRVQHAGRIPLNSEAAQQSRQRQEELTRRMAAAVEAEDFETAAQLRDQIRLLAQAQTAEKEAKPHG